MDIRVLEYYLMVAREENITKAAELLHVTQPTLSRQLIQLEAELGCKLFTRTNHSIILTEEGIMLKRRAQEIVELTNKTKNDLVGKTVELNGEISIGCGEFQSVSFLVEIMEKFKNENPLVTFRMYSGNSSNIKEWIESGILDMGVVLDYIDISKYEYVRIPQKEEWGILVPDNSPLAKKEYITPSDIQNSPLILSEGTLSNQSFAEWMGKSYDEMNIVSTYNLMYNAALMVAGGMGIAGGIKLNCAYDKVKFVSAHPTVESKTVLAWKKTFSQSHTVAAFIRYCELYIK